MSRVDQLAQDNLVTTLTQLRTDIDQLKERQVTSMASGVLGYFNQTANTWDSIATYGADTDTSAVTKIYTLTFVGDGSQPVTFANLGYAIYSNGTDSAHQLTIPNVDWTDGTRKAHFAPNAVSVSFNTYSVQIFIITLKQVTIYFKAFVPASQRLSSITLGIV